MLLNSNLFCYSSKYGSRIRLLIYQNTCADPEFFWGQMDIFASKGRWVQDQSSMTLPRQFNTVEFPVDLGMDLSFRTTRQRSVFRTPKIWGAVLFLAMI